MGKVIICMPEYNEGSVIFDFVDEIKAQLLEVNFVIVDDNSSQEFKDQMINKYNNRQDINLVLNEKNLGHGISTLKALQEAIKLDFDIVIGIDGDGQFLATDIKKCLDYLNSDKYLEIVEGVRSQRDIDKWFRKIVSMGTRILIFFKVGILPQDANTPLRVYRKETLKRILAKVPENSMIPNLHISKLTRQMKINFKEISVKSLPRGGGNKKESIQGVTWKQKFSQLPSKRFIKFCIKAINEWVRN